MRSYWIHFNNYILSSAHTHPTPEQLMLTSPSPQAHSWTSKDCKRFGSELWDGMVGKTKTFLKSRSIRNWHRFQCSCAPQSLTLTSSSHLISSGGASFFRGDLSLFSSGLIWMESQLSSPTWWIISCVARCETIWWTLLPPAEPERFIILPPSQGSQLRSRSDSEKDGWFLWSYLFFLSVSQYMSWALSEISVSCGLNFASEIKGLCLHGHPLLSWLSRGPQLGHGEPCAFFPVCLC